MIIPPLCVGARWRVMARDAPPIAAGLFLVGSRLFSSPRVSAVSKQINAAPYRFSATDSCRCHVEASLIVSSLRPSFPQLRRSPPIPSLPWLLAADLFRGCSAQLEALPCHSAASQCTSIPSHRCFAVSRQFNDLPLKSMAAPCFSFLINSISALVVVCRLAAMPLLFSSFPFSASRLHAPPSQHWSSQSPSIPPPFRCLSAHLRLHRSWPFPCSSHRFGSWLCHIPASPSDAVSNHLRYSQRRSVSLLLHCFTKQGGSNPLPLVSGRFRLCSAFPSQFG